MVPVAEGLREPLVRPRLMGLEGLEEVGAVMLPVAAGLEAFSEEPMQ